MSDVWMVYKRHSDSDHSWWLWPQLIAVAPTLEQAQAYALSFAGRENDKTRWTKRIDDGLALEYEYAWKSGTSWEDADVYIERVSVVGEVVVIDE